MLSIRVAPYLIAEIVSINSPYPYILVRVQVYPFFGVLEIDDSLGNVYQLHYSIIDFNIYCILFMINFNSNVIGVTFLFASNKLRQELKFFLYIFVHSTVPVFQI